MAISVFDRSARKTRIRDHYYAGNDVATIARAEKCTQKTVKAVLKEIVAEDGGVFDRGDRKLLIQTSIGRLVRTAQRTFKRGEYHDTAREQVAIERVLLDVTNAPLELQDTGDESLYNAYDAGFAGVTAPQHSESEDADPE